MQITVKLPSEKLPPDVYQFRLNFLNAIANTIEAFNINTDEINITCEVCDWDPVPSTLNLDSLYLYCQLKFRLGNLSFVSIIDNIRMQDSLIDILYRQVYLSLIKMCEVSLGFKSVNA